MEPHSIGKRFWNCVINLFQDVIRTGERMIHLEPDVAERRLPARAQPRKRRTNAHLIHVT